MKFNLITILGPTAVGKTRLAALLANHFNGEIISADSRQVYKGMDIGTGKDLSDYFVDGKTVPYHLIDIFNPMDEFNVFIFYKLFFQSYNSITNNNKVPVLCGGTGLYIHSVIKDYEMKEVEFDQERYNELNKYDYDDLKNNLIEIQPNQHNTTDLINKERVIRALMIAGTNKLKAVEFKTKINSFNIGVKLDRELVRERITARLKYRLENGMVEECKRLIQEGVSYERLEQFGLEYKFLSKYIKNEINYNEMFEKLNIAIHQFSKRQMTWFRKMEREGIKINWIDGADFKRAEQLILQNYFV